MKLSQQAKKVFERLKSAKQLHFEELQEEGLDQSMVARSAKELEEKGLAEISEEEEVAYELTKKGRNVIREGSPEYRLKEILEEGPKEFSDINIPADVAVGKAREKGWIEIEDGVVSLTGEGERVATDEVVEQLEDENFGADHVERGLVDRITEVTRILKLTRKGEQVKTENIEEEFNVEARTESEEIGKKHFYRQVMDEARDVWVEMGFQEMQGDYIVPGFTCFDSLFIAQDHPSRDLQDTFFVEDPESSDLEEFGGLVERIEEVHENGGDTGSRGWGYDWSREEASKNVLRTHTTATSVEKLIELEEEDLPAKYFIVSRAFRNETVDRTHLADFDQTEGIVVGKNLNFAHLKGYLTEFFEKMGYYKFRLVPSYYPYTEMSVEIQVWDKEENEWLGMGGAGLFRPEVVKPLLGFEAVVLAWGIGIGRIGMRSAELEDIRGLYSNDKQKIYETPLWNPQR
ncbi:MAG: phenylalanine--tRNA ligase subunit alpha [Candidatus Nanohaloarchaea archaeon]